MVNILAGYGASKLDEVESIKLFVGGIPTEPKPPIGGISMQLEVQSQTTTETVTELVYSAKRVNAFLKESVYEAESMQKVSSEGYTKIISIDEQTGKIHHKTVEMANPLVI